MPDKRESKNGLRMKRRSVNLSRKQTQTRKYFDSLAGFQGILERYLIDGKTPFFRGQRCQWPIFAPSINRFETGTKKDHQLQERLLVEFFKAKVKMGARAPKNDWEWLALAQHHGFPTRLLDWSTDPFKALWFAVKKDAVATKGFRGIPRGALYMFFPEDTRIVRHDSVDPWAARTTKYFIPSVDVRGLSERIQAQSGAFSIHPYDNNLNHRMGNWGRMFPRNLEEYNLLIRVHIDPRAFPKLRRELKNVGIDQSTMFPDPHLYIPKKELLAEFYEFLMARTKNRGPE